MAVQETTPTVGAMARLDRAQAKPEAAEPAAKPVRRLPVQKDWPTWALIAAQIGILVGSLSEPEQRPAFFRPSPPQKPASLLSLLRFATVC